MNADLVKTVSQSMPEASIEQVLDEVRRISVRSISASVLTKTLKGPMETLEHVIQTYDLTLEDTKAVMTQAGHHELAESPLFEVLYTYLTPIPDTRSSCRCFPWKGSRTCTKN
jgi:hypothetical protein